MISVRRIITIDAVCGKSRDCMGPFNSCLIVEIATVHDQSTETFDLGFEEIMIE